LWIQNPIQIHVSVEPSRKIPTISDDFFYKKILQTKITVTIYIYIQISSF